MEPAFQKITIVGVGLLGGSLGMAALQRGISKNIVGVGRTPTALQEALRQGAITHGTTDLTEGLANADLVVLCTPVKHIAEILPDVIAATPKGAIITDVGSTKATIVTRADQLTRTSGHHFVGSHPMAGSEKSGVSHARANLFDRSTCFITRSPHTNSTALARVALLWRQLGANLVFTRPERHDTLTGLVSHLPHLAAVALIRTVDQFNEDRNLIRGIIGNGFRDTTRIAGGNPDMWQDICTDNHDNIKEACAGLEKSLTEIIAACEKETTCESLHQILSQAREFREFLATADPRK